MRQAKPGFQSKEALSRFPERQERYKLPSYFDDHHSIYVDGVPPQYTVHSDAAHQEMKQIFAKLKTVLQLYDDADPLSY